MIWKVEMIERKTRFSIMFSGIVSSPSGIRLPQTKCVPAHMDKHSYTQKTPLLTWKRKKPLQVIDLFMTKQLGHKKRIII